MHSFALNQSLNDSFGTRLQEWQAKNNTSRVALWHNDRCGWEIFDGFSRGRRTTASKAHRAIRCKL